MNNLDIPDIDDVSILRALNTNRRLEIFPHLLNAELQMCAAFNSYQKSYFSPALVFRPMTEAQIDYLCKRFNSPPKDLNFIKQMREASDSRECPMCGSMHSGTLDHYLPKSTFPIFSLYSRNLVPACKCNSKRGVKIHGDSPGQRILHPYYDNCLSERLVSAKFDDLGEVPKVSVRLVVATSHPMYAAISFHFDEIVKKSAIEDYLANRWSKLFRKPGLVVRAFKKNFSSVADVQNELESELDDLDDLHGGKNNWNSIFVQGLLEPQTLIWLAGRLTDPARKPNTQL